MKHMNDAWTRILDNDFAVPQGVRPVDLLDDLLDGLAAADPAVRDGLVYPVFATWVERGHFDDSAELVGERICTQLAHPQIQARTFAALIIAELVSRDTARPIVSASVMGRWYDAFSCWWLAEKDLRGYDTSLGWLHAVAHGADTVGAFGVSRHSDAERLRDLIGLVITRVLRDEHLWDALEDQRLALALTSTLLRDELAHNDVEAWLLRISQVLRRDADAVPVPVWRQNLLRLMNAVYVHASRARLTEDGASRWSSIEPALTDTIRSAWPPLA